MGEGVKIIRRDVAHGEDNEKMFKDAIELYKRSCNKEKVVKRDITTSSIGNLSTDTLRSKNKNYDNELLKNKGTDDEHVNNDELKQLSVSKSTMSNLMNLENDNFDQTNEVHFSDESCLESSKECDGTALPPWLNPDISDENSSVDLSLSSFNTTSLNAKGSVGDNDSKKLSDETVDASGFSTENICKDKFDLDTEELDRLNEGVLLSNKNQDQTERVQGGLYRDYLLNKKRSITTEMVNVERFFNIDQSEIATLVCGMLNTDDGGTIYLGVNSNSIIKGVKLDRKQRDKTRMIIDRVCTQNLLPRAPPNLVTIDFIPIINSRQDDKITELQVVKITVQGQKGKKWRVKDVSGGFMDGVYIRNGKAPDYNVLVD